jgi:NitT/TauT family transport system substrate-binding protein
MTAKRHSCALSAIAAVAMLSLASAALAADKVKLASSQRGAWDTTLVQFGADKGIFAKHGIDLDISWTAGGADTQQAVISGAIDIGIATGTLGVLSAHAQKAPIRIISAQMTGSPDLYWYATTKSGIKSPKDWDGKQVGYSRPGSSSHLLAQSLAAAAGVKATFVASGTPPATLTQVMSGQIDVGWSVPPLGFDQIEKGAIVVVGKGNDVPGVAEQTVRVNAANLAFLKSKRDVARRFLMAYEETINWAYASDEVLTPFAEMNKVTVAQAKQARDQFYPKATLRLAPIGGLEQTMKEAIEFKRLREPMTKQQIDEMIDLVYEPKG